MAQGNRLQTLDRGLSALALLGARDEGLTIAELAEALGVHRAIAYRIAATLEAHALVHRAEGGRLVLGPGILALSARFEGNLRAIARPIVDALTRRTGATAFLSVAQGEDCVAVLTSVSQGPFLDVGYRTGSRHPLTRGAAGVAILSGRPAAPGEAENVAEARARGYSLTRGELQPGAAGLAVPVHLGGAGFPGLECSLGVVTLGEIDAAALAPEVRAAAAELAQAVRSGGGAPFLQV